MLSAILDDAGEASINSVMGQPRRHPETWRDLIKLTSVGRMRSALVRMRPPSGANTALVTSGPIEKVKAWRLITTFRKCT